MASSNIQNLNRLDEEFNRDTIKVGKMINQIKSLQDRKICNRFLKRCLDLDCPLLAVKQDRNDFLKYLEKLIVIGLKMQATLKPVKPKKAKKEHQQVQAKEHAEFSEDRRTYFSTMTVPGFAVLVYMATSDEPNAEWLDNGFSPN